jgi:hypothetical protein
MYATLAKTCTARGVDQRVPPGRISDACSPEMQPLCPTTHGPAPPSAPLQGLQPRTCKGITIPKIFFSLSDRTYLTKAQPEPIKAMVMKRSAPLSLGKRA